MRPFFLLFLLFSTLLAHENKLVFLIAGPRSMSTLFLRMMTSRGDFVTYNEPATPRFVRKHLPQFDIAFKEGMVWDDATLFQKLDTKRAHSHVFVKELCNRLAGLFELHPELLQDPNVHIVFLIRDPLKSVQSQFKGISKIPAVNLDDYDFSHLIGLSEVRDAYTKFAGKCANPPLIIFADELCNKPRKIVSRFRKDVGVPFSRKHLSWQPCDLKKDELPPWHENKLFRDVLIWHQAVLESSGFQRQKRFEKDEANFSHIEEGYLANLPHFEFFKQEAKVRCPTS